MFWPAGTKTLPARRCTCSFCLRFNGTWTSHPDAALDIRESPERALTRYRFGTGSADFLFCSHCGVAIAAVSESESGLRAVVNINTLDDRDQLVWQCSDSDFDAESLEQRLARRQARWIGRVRFLT